MHESALAIAGACYRNSWTAGILVCMFMVRADWGERGVQGILLQAYPAMASTKIAQRLLWAVIKRNRELPRTQKIERIESAHNDMMRCCGKARVLPTGGS